MVNSVQVGRHARRRTARSTRRRTSRSTPGTRAARSTSTARGRHGGNIQLRGRLRVEFYRPGASTPFDGVLDQGPGRVDPGLAGRGVPRHRRTSPASAPSSGTWKVRASTRTTTTSAAAGPPSTATAPRRQRQRACRGAGTERSRHPDRRRLPAPAGSTQVAGARPRTAPPSRCRRRGWPTGRQGEQVGDPRLGVELPRRARRGGARRQAARAGPARQPDVDPGRCPPS